MDEGRARGGCYGAERMNACERRAAPGAKQGQGRSGEVRPRRGGKTDQGIREASGLSGAKSAERLGFTCSRAMGRSRAMAQRMRSKTLRRDPALQGVLEPVGPEAAVRREKKTPCGIDRKSLLWNNLRI